MQLLSDDNVYAIIKSKQRWSAERLKNGDLYVTLNGHEVSETIVPALILKLFKRLLPVANKLTAMDSFRVAYKVLLSESEQYHDSKMIKSLRYRLSEIERVLTVNTSRLIFQ